MKNEAAKSDMKNPETVSISSTTSSQTSRRYVTVGDETISGAKKPGLGYFPTFMHLVKCYIATGIFAMGEALKNGGVVLGSVLLAFIAVMNLHCQHKLIRASLKVAATEVVDVKPSFAETVEYTAELSNYEWCRKHSQKLGVITNIFLCVTELGFCCVYFVFIAEHLAEIAENYGLFEQYDYVKKTYIMLAIILVPMWLSTFLGNLKLLFPITIIANFLLWSGIIMIVYFMLEGKMSDDIKLASSYKTIPLFFGTALYSFEGITFIIPLRNEMKDPTKFSSPLGVLNVGMVFVYILLNTMGILAYLKYGQNVRSSVFLNLPGKQVFCDVLKVMITLSVLFTFTLHMYVPFEITYPLFYVKYGPFKHDLLVQIIYRTVPVLATYTLANVIPFLGLFITLVGATTGSFLALIIPSVLDFVAWKGELKVFQIITNIIILTVGVVGACLGSLLSIYEIIMAFKNYGSNSTTPIE